ncbi:Uncharacterised protein [Chromobacterium violaceum]|uniref:Transmembrane protein n=1 Tax=Chromobacterium violaceum TaxID=536 RepID=A0AAX2MBL7_CHRVL|nr:Uncharacterised protein [Chromobacterium violaceum]SUX33732.1 Uncharacterised protein [Chromobacterium violaceum]
MSIREPTFLDLFYIFYGTVFAFGIITSLILIPKIIKQRNENQRRLIKQVRMKKNALSLYAFKKRAKYQNNKTTTNHRNTRKCKIQQIKKGQSQTSPFN